MRSVERSACISGSSCGADLDDGVQVGPVVPEEIRQALQAHFRAHVREVPTRTEVASEGCVLLFLPYVDNDDKCGNNDGKVFKSTSKTTNTMTTPTKTQD